LYDTMYGIAANALVTRQARTYPEAIAIAQQQIATGAYQPQGGAAQTPPAPQGVQAPVQQPQVPAGNLNTGYNRQTVTWEQANQERIKNGGRIIQAKDGTHILTTKDGQTYSVLPQGAVRSNQPAPQKTGKYILK